MKGLRHFTDRVLALKAEQDKLAEDIKQVYAEAHAARFNKTRMGELVAYLRKRAKGQAKLEESEAIFAAYLHEYDHGTVPAREDTHAHAGEALPPHDETTGELIEDPSAAQAAEGESFLTKWERVIKSDPALGQPKAEAGTAGVVLQAPSSMPASEGEEAIELQTSPSQINPEAKASEVESGTAGGTGPCKTINHRAGLVSRLSGGRTPDGEGAEPDGVDAPSQVPPADSPLVSKEPGSIPPEAVEPGSLSDPGEIPACLDRRAQMEAA